MYKGSHYYPDFSPETGCEEGTISNYDYMGSGCYDNYVNSLGSDVSYTYAFEENLTVACSWVC